MRPSIPSRSKAFSDYVENRSEVIKLLQSSPSDLEQVQSKKKRELGNAIYRGSVVLLSSHLERYLEDLVVEAVDAINYHSPIIDRVPEQLRLTQVDSSMRAIRIALTDPRDPDKVIDRRDMEKKAATFKSFLEDCDRFFTSQKPCERLNASVLIDRFANPTTEKIIALFRFFGIGNVIQQAIVLDGKPDRMQIQGMVDELVSKRNSIAHSGMTTDVTKENVINYVRYSRRLVRCLDVVVGNNVKKIIGDWPWNIPEISAIP